MSVHNFKGQHLSIPTGTQIAEGTEKTQGKRIFYKVFRTVQKGSKLKCSAAASFF